jgi:hypothetical protein
MAAPAARAALRASIIDAGLTAVLAFFLLLPLIGYSLSSPWRRPDGCSIRW